MAKLTKFTNPFGMTPNELLNNKEVSLKAKGMFGYLQSKPENWKFSINGISSQLKEGNDSVRAALQELEKFGYLKRCNYNNTTTGKWVTDYYLSDLPYTENTDTVKHRDGKTPMLSNKDLSNKDKRKKRPEAGVDLPKNLTKEVWEEWVIHRKEIKKKLTPSTIKRQMQLLSKEKDPAAIINKSIQNGWAGLFPEKTQKTVTKKSPQYVNPEIFNRD